MMAQAHEAMRLNARGRDDDAAMTARRRARRRFDHQDIESSNLKIFKVMPKCGLKPLIISICGGNMPMKMMKRIIIAHDNNIVNDVMR